MAVLARVNLSAQQRWDTHHKLMAESFAAFDFRALISSIVGSDAFVVRGFEVVGKTGLTAQLKISDAFVFNPQDSNGSMFYGLTTEEDVFLALPASQQNLYIEAKFLNETRAPVNSAFWDPLSLTGEDASGSQYTAAADSQSVMILEITANTTQFTPGSIPLAWASTNTNSVTSFEDRRNMFGRLGKGGDTPNSLYKFPWATSRGEPVPSGTGVGQAVDSPWRSETATGALNDKAFGSLKDVIDAILTRFCEITGSALWYTSGLASSPVANVSVNQIFFDTLGHSIQPSTSASFVWKRVSSTLRLAGEGTVPVDGLSGTHLDGLVKWQSNYSKLEWQLGGTFATGFRTYQSGQARFVSPAPDDKGNVYLYLEREVPKGSGAGVSWADNTQEGSFLGTKAVSGQPGDFTGIALGDFIRKESEGYSRYYRVVKMSDGTIIFNNTVTTETSKIADNTIVALELEDAIIGGPSTEALKFFRSRYSQADLYADQNIATNGYLYQDSNFYWLGRRSGDLFNLKDYGTMQENEESFTLNDAWSGIAGGSSQGALVIEHAQQAWYDATNGYELKSGSGTLLTIRRRLSDNTTEVPGSGDNSDSLLTYTITAPVGLLATGQSLWVRLSETAGGVLVSGSVISPADDLGNTDAGANVWEILDDTDSPLQTTDNRNIFLVARKETIAGQESLLFFDGSVIAEYGLLFNQNVEITGELALTTRPAEGVLFIHETIPGQVDDDVSQLFYTQSTGLFGVRTFRVEDNSITLSTPASVDFLTNLGANTLNIGEASSLSYIPGDLTVDDEVKLTSRASQGILFIDETVPALVVDEVAQLFYTQSTGTFGVRTFRFTDNNILLSAAADVNVLTNVGNNTLTLGSPNTTTYIPGDLIVDGNTIQAQTTQVLVEDKLITLGVGNLVNGGFDSGIEIADDTILGTSFDSTAASPEVEITLASAPGYSLGDVIGVTATAGIGGITAGQIGGQYTIVATLSAAGEATISGATLTLQTAVNATSTATSSTTPPKVFKTEWAFKVSDSAGTVAGITSWMFKVKGVATTPTITPVSGYGIVPTANDTDMVATRIPFVAADGVGPGGADTTFDFSADLTWNGTDLSLGGNLVPALDDTYDIGTTALRWKTLHVGPGSVIVHGDDTDTLKVQLRYSGSDGILDTDSTSGLQLSSAGTNGIRLDTDGRMSVGATATDASSAVLLQNPSVITTGANQSGLNVQPSLSGTTTSVALSITTTQDTDAVTDLANIKIFNPALVSGGTATNNYGLQILDQTSGTNNFGVHSGITSGTGKWFLYGNGSATSYLAGGVGIGNSTQASINTQRLLLGTVSDSTAAGGMNFGTDVPLYRSAINTLTLGSHFLPQTDNTWDLGSSGFRWRTLYATSLALTGGFQVNVSTVKTSAYNITTSDMLIRYNTTGGAFTITLPASDATNKGQMVIVKDVGGFVGQTGKAMTLARTGGDTIDGSATNLIVNFAPFVSLTLIADGAGGWVIT